VSITTVLGFLIALTAAAVSISNVPGLFIAILPVSIAERVSRAPTYSFDARGPGLV
jgi:hypothetical protein